ncbi:hypothetical protein [Thorsellia anophelis]|uniref:Uncharacterized protein n=1 Tax=Thorsellia anophelis DSM 18579 TaxID=1123402 RepID=A0A1H9YEE9_9GAMM|nr:hypothetical protein [Thorsellia anophelis]SES67319.1 hypothetical protein SAMN02583745_00215 [Thorsellia anophelis DSM 18579]
MPNEFWPSTPMPPVALTRMDLVGNSIQQKTAANNPDVFCKSQGSGYRLPSIGEFHAQTKSLSPGSSYQPKEPAHWSQYINNDTTKARLPNDTTRNVNGSLYNEWGDVSKYANGWEAGNYWSTEISVLNNFRGGNNFQNWFAGGGYGRIIFVGTGATSYPPSSGGADYTVYTNVNALYNVACIRDLVPTPSTPTPSKS